MIDNGPQVRYVSVLNVSSSGGGGGTINGTIANTQVAYGTASDTIGGENDFTYDATNNILTVDKILSQVFVQYVADETIAVGELLRVVNSNDAPLTPGRTVLSSSTDLVNSTFLGIALDTGNQGDTIGVATSGKVQIKFSSAPASSSNGQKVYVSGTGGIATLTAPTGSGNVVYQVGVLVGANGVSTTPLVDLNFQEIIVID